MCRIVSYKMYETLAALVARGEVFAGKEHYKKAVQEPLEQLGVSLEKAKEAVERERQKYELIREVVSRDTRILFKGAIEAAQSGDASIKDALDAACADVVDAEVLWQRLS